jgi:hypothetical protein
MAEDNDISNAGRYQELLDQLATLRALLVNKNRNYLPQSCQHNRTTRKQIA